MKIEIEDRIYWYRSRKANRTYPVYVFGGDTDMATEGKVSFTSLERDEVVIVDALRLGADERGDPDALEARVNAGLGRSDLRYQRVRKIPGGKNEYEPLDIYDPSQAVAHGREQAIAEFLGQGGQITGFNEPVAGIPAPSAAVRSRVLFILLSLIPMAAGFWTAARIGILCRQGREKYGWDFSNSVPLFNWRTWEGWTDSFTLLGHELFFAACMGAGYWILRVQGRHKRDILKGLEGWLFYAVLIASILAIIIFAIS